MEEEGEKEENENGLLESNKLVRPKKNKKPAHQKSKQPTSDAISRSEKKKQRGHR